MRPGVLASIAVASLVALAGGAWAESWITQVAQRQLPRALPGWPLYARLCLPCHGSDGDGRGPAAPYVWPAPRALVSGELKWRSTPTGQPATDDDVRHTIALGAPGTAMPGFGDALTGAQIDDLVAVVRAFAPSAMAGTGATAAAPVQLGEPPPPDPARGAVLWFARGCPACHGPAGDGRAPSDPAARAPPYDLTAGLHRPRQPGRDAARRAAALSIATGLTGTAMRGHAGALPDAELWALADHVVGLAGAGAPRSPPPPAMDPATIAADRQAPITLGTWPGRGDADEVAVFGQPVAPQGPPPAQLAPAQASLRSQHCARCHARQFRDWTSSVHRGAASPGLLAQTEYGMAAEERAMCLRCHAPLAEQALDPELRGDGLSCAGCHVRGWVRRGPPGVSPALLPLPGYPLVTTGLFQRSDLCLPCHQLPPRTAVAGRPLLDTYREWLMSPYFARGVQCQHCHMPEREHAVRGVHDPATFRQGIELGARAHRRGAEITAVVTIKNAGAGHYLPTTPTPAAWLTITLIDAHGRAILGATARHRIGRDIWFDGSWHERADTRIPPGETVTVARAWTGRTAEAVAARITLEVHPDEFYERFYADRLAEPLAPAQRALYQRALARAVAARYVAEQRDAPIP